MASLVPTPSVLLASRGSRYFVGVEAEQPGEAAQAADDLRPAGPAEPAPS
jgi:hypothetical protein